MKYNPFKKEYDFMYGETVLWIGNVLKGGRSKIGRVVDIRHAFFGLNTIYRISIPDPTNPKRTYEEDCSGEELRLVKESFLEEHLSNELGN